MINRYLIDANVLSVLLRTKDKDVIENNYNKVLIGLETVVDETINEFFKQKGLTIDFVTIKALPSDKLDPNVSILLKSKELGESIDRNVQLFFKKLIEVYWDKLNDAERLDIENYLNNYEQVYKERLKLVLDNIDAINQVSDQLKNSIISDYNSGRVNLGGNLTKSIPVSSQDVAAN